MYHLYNRHMENGFVFKEEEEEEEASDCEKRESSPPRQFQCPYHRIPLASNYSSRLRTGKEKSGLYKPKQETQCSILYDADDLAYNVATAQVIVDQEKEVTGNHQLDHHAGVQAYHVAAHVAVQEERIRREMKRSTEQRRQDRLHSTTQYILQLALQDDENDDDDDTEEAHETDQVHLSSSHSEHSREVVKCAKQFSDASSNQNENQDHLNKTPSQDTRAVPAICQESSTQKQAEIPSEIRIRNQSIRQIRDSGRLPQNLAKSPSESSQENSKESKRQRNLQVTTAVHTSRNEMHGMVRLNDSEVVTKIPINALIIDDLISEEYYQGKQKLTLWLPSSSA